MSYSAAPKQATRYREMQVMAASPGELIVMVYDHLLSQLHRAQALQGASNLAARSDALEKCRAALCELLVTLDQEKGGALGTQLAAIYSFLLGELTTLGLRPDTKRYERVIRIVRELREAFAQAAAQTAPALVTARQA
ncbi:MAG: flagellar export chaperone FliS [Gemmatimonadaceae bacterium]